jgi:uncharacterized protein (TIGR04255 family)
MPPGNYDKPPITEAVIAFQFQDELATDGMAKVTEKFASSYPTYEPNFELAVSVERELNGIGAKATASTKLAGFRMSGGDQFDLIIFNTHDLAISRLAPYLGWVDLFAKARQSFETFRSLVGYRNLTRLAVRYINRLDIPSAVTDRIEPATYLRTFPAYPGLDPIAFDEFGTQVIFKVQDIQARARVATAGVPSPLIDHKSLLLDIDIFCVDDLPNRPESIYELLEKLHTAKNIVFETCVTDTARELFDHA